FEATSTLHDFTGTAPVEPFPVSVVQEGDFALLEGTAAVAVAQMDTRHAKRDANLRKTFAAERYPLIIGTVAPIRIDLNTPPPSIPIQLTICERTRTVPATVSNWQSEEGFYRFELTLSLSLQAFALEPPVILGFIRVGDAVVVRARVQLAKPPGSARP
ncbi:MAG: YceI family protein, partial [Kiritimatiellia bacterium]